MTTGERVDQVRGRDRGLTTAEVLAVLAGEITPTELDSTIYGGTPVAIDPDDAGAAGTAATLSRSDHAHEFLTATAVALTETATSSEGTSGDAARADHVHATNVLPWGVVAQQVETTNDGGHSADTATDFALSNVPVVAGRLYAIHMHSDVLFASVDVNARWVLRLRLNGSNIAVFEDLEPRVGGNSRRVSDATCYWEAPTTQATDDFDVFADEIVNGADITLEASATNPRWFTITDIGEAP